MTCDHHNCDADGSLPGSRGPAKFPRWEIKGVGSSAVCFLPMITAFSNDCLELYRHYKNGHLVVAGGLVDQPRVYLQAMGVIDANA
ncbi:MAG: hypothetical protein ACR2Q3_01615 [Woeseiaceae bacterium]